VRIGYTKMKGIDVSVVAPFQIILKWLRGVEDIGVGSREVLVRGETDLEFCCQKIDTSKAFDKIMETKVIIIFSAHAIAFGK